MSKCSKSALMNASSRFIAGPANATSAISRRGLRNGSALVKGMATAIRSALFELAGNDGIPTKIKLIMLQDLIDSL